jgi:hypothetical protein
MDMWVPMGQSPLPNHFLVTGHTSGDHWHITASTTGTYRSPGQTVRTQEQHSLFVLESTATLGQRADSPELLRVALARVLYDLVELDNPAITLGRYDGA